MSLLCIASFLIVKHSCVREEFIDLPFFLQTQLQQITVKEHLFGEFTLAPLTFEPCTSPTDTFPFHSVLNKTYEKARTELSKNREKNKIQKIETVRY